MTILTARAHQVLTALETNDDLDSLTDTLALDRGFVQQTITHLIDVGLVIGVGEGTYDLTPSGRRVLARAHGGTAAESYELDPAVLQALETFQLRPDREAALRAVYLFLKYWGDATQSEIQDAIYREHPANYDNPADWWTSMIRQKLYEIPHVSGPDADDSSVWRYTGFTVHEHGVDGRHVAGAYGSVRHAIEHLTRPGPERTAVREAFTHLFVHESCSKRDLVESVFVKYPAGYESADAWWDQCLRPVFERLPRVERTVGPENGWQYTFVPV